MATKVKPKTQQPTTRQCNFCKRQGHTEMRCWDLGGSPATHYRVVYSNNKVRFSHTCLRSGHTDSKCWDLGKGRPHAPRCRYGGCSRRVENPLHTFLILALLIRDWSSSANASRSSCSAPTICAIDGTKDGHLSSSGLETPQGINTQISVKGMGYF